MDFDHRYCQATLSDRIDVTDDLAVFRLEPNQKLEFQAGQYVTIGLDEDAARPLLRPYSVVSAPHQDFLEVFVEKGPDGLFTPHLWRLLNGDTCWLRKRIVGRFLLNSDAERHLMLATVTGIAPYVSMIRKCIHGLSSSEVPPAPMLIIHGASRPDEFGPYRKELTGYAGQFDWLEYHPTVSRPWNHSEWAGECGRVGDVLRKIADSRGFLDSDTTLYACGHPGMIKNAEAIAHRAGFPEITFVKEEYFRE